ncbi:MAG: hypothetical protein U1E45_06825 [Geminicoccaceae bacterium]
MKRGLWAMAGLGLLAIGVELARAGGPAVPAVDVKAALVARGFAALGEVPVTSGGTVHVQRFRAPGCRSRRWSPGSIFRAMRWHWSRRRIRSRRCRRA